MPPLHARSCSVSRSFAVLLPMVNSDKSRVAWGGIDFFLPASARVAESVPRCTRERGDAASSGGVCMPGAALRDVVDSRSEPQAGDGSVECGEAYSESAIGALSCRLSTVQYWTGSSV